MLLAKEEKWSYYCISNIVKSLTRTGPKVCLGQEARKWLGRKYESLGLREGRVSMPLVRLAMVTILLKELLSGSLTKWEGFLSETSCIRIATALLDLGWWNLFVFGKYLGSLWIPTPLRGPSDPSQPGWNSSEVIEKLPVTPCFQIWKILWDEIRNPNRWKSRETGDLTHLKAALMSWAGSRSKYQKCLFLSDSSKMRISQRGNWVGNSKLISNVRALFCHYLKLCHILLYMF